MNKILLLISLFFFYSTSIFAQEPMMAEGNYLISFTYGTSNHYKRQLEKKLLSDNLASYVQPIYLFTNPMEVQFEYAISDYSAIGAQYSAFAYTLAQNYRGLSDTFEVNTTGTRMSLQLRGIRYFTNSPKFTIYCYGSAGLRWRSFNTSANSDYQKAAPSIHRTPETNPFYFNPFAYEVGIGTRIMVYKSIGICGEFGTKPGIVQVGLFYKRTHKARRKKDSFGW